MQYKKMSVYCGFTNVLLTAETSYVLETREPLCWSGRYFKVFDNTQLYKFTAAANQ